MTGHQQTDTQPFWCCKLASLHNCKQVEACILSTQPLRNNECRRVDASINMFCQQHLGTHQKHDNVSVAAGSKEDKQLEENHLKEEVRTREEERKRKRVALQRMPERHIP